MRVIEEKHHNPVMQVQNEMSSLGANKLAPTSNNKASRFKLADNVVELTAEALC